MWTIGEKSVEQYHEVLKLNPEFFPALNNLAYIYSHQDEKLEEAEDLAQKAFKLEPSNAGITDTLGWILYKKGDYQESLRLLEQSGSEAPDHPEIQYHLGMARLKMGQNDLARTALEKALSIDRDFPGKDDAKRQLAVMGDRDSAFEAMELADLNAFVKDNQGDLLAQVHLAKRLESLEEAEKAAAIYQSVLKVNPELSEPLKGLARLYLGPLEDSEKALSFARKAREYSALGDLEPISLVGLAALREGKASWAYGLLQDAVQTSNQDAQLLHSLGWSAYFLGKLKESREAMGKVVELAPESSEGQDAQAFLAMTDSELNTEAASRKLEEDGDYVPALMVRAKRLSLDGKAGDAIAVYDGILSRWADFPLAQKELATVLARGEERLDEARSLGLSARKAFPGDAELARVLGTIGFKRGEAEYAIGMLEEKRSNHALGCRRTLLLGDVLSNYRARCER